MTHYITNFSPELNQTKSIYKKKTKNINKLKLIIAIVIDYNNNCREIYRNIKNIYIFIKIDSACKTENNN